MLPRPIFVLFGPAHLAVLALSLLVPLALALLARKSPPLDRPIRLALAAILAGGWLCWYALFGLRGWLTLGNCLPLNLCDWAAVALIAALLTRGQFAYELGYFWGLGGTLQGLITPDIAYGFPDPQFIFFSINHAGIMTALLYLTWTGMRPVLASLPRVVAATLGYAVVAGAADMPLRRQLRLSRSQAHQCQRDGFSVALALVHPRACRHRRPVAAGLLRALLGKGCLAAQGIKGAVHRHAGHRLMTGHQPLQAKPQPLQHPAGAEVAGMGAGGQQFQSQSAESVGDHGGHRLSGIALAPLVAAKQKSALGALLRKVDQAEIATADGVALPPYRPVAAKRSGRDLFAHHLFGHRQPRDGRAGARKPSPRYRPGWRTAPPHRFAAIGRRLRRSVVRIMTASVYAAPEKHEAAGCFRAVTASRLPPSKWTLGPALDSPTAPIAKHCGVSPNRPSATR